MSVRIDIASEDRLGITQAILAIFAKNQCNLIAMEVVTFHTYVHFSTGSVSLQQVEDQLLTIVGVSIINTIELLPVERRQRHLDALLSRLPDPIFDINAQGEILIASASAAKVCNVSQAELEGQNLSRFFAEPLEQLLTTEPSSLEVNVLRQPYLANITPVTVNGKVTGAVLELQSPQRMGRQISALQQTNDKSINNMLGQSPAMLDIGDKIRRFGRLDLPVLISGETGTGKELLAQALHHQGADPEAPFLAINCAALAESLLESELFGYAPGAFSGAQRGGKPGLFELAAGGTVFLDEIGEMSTYLQAKLLRVLQDYTFRRVGGTKEIQVKIRVISASHRDLETMAREGKFREDLFYRLNVLNIHLPPLRERRSDIPLLVSHFVTRAAAQVGLPEPKVTSAAMQLLSQFDWPGNIRQLENQLFRSIALLNSDKLDSEDIRLPSTQSSNTKQGEQSEENAVFANLEQEPSWQSAQQTFEKALLNCLYPLHPSTRKLANRLQVSHNKIAMKLKQHGIDS